MIITEVRIVVHNSKLFFIIPFYKNLFALGTAKARHTTRGRGHDYIHLWIKLLNQEFKFLEFKMQF